MMKLTSRLIMAAAFAAPLALGQNVQFTNDVLKRNPLAYWKFDGNENSQAGAGLTLINGNPTNPAGYTQAGGGAPIGDALGEAAILNSYQGQYFTIPGGTGGPLSFDTSHAFSLMAWVKTADQGLSLMPIVGKVDSSQTGYLLFIDNNAFPFPNSIKGGGRFGLLLDVQGKITLAESMVSVNDGAWHFLVATYDGSGTQAGIQLYLDGAVVATQGNPNQPQVAGSILNTASFAIGGGLPAAPSVGTFEGLIDEVAVFGTALTQTQVQKLAADAVTAPIILSQFAFGGGWYSAVYFTNIGGPTVTFPVAFTKDDGTPLTIPSLGGASTTLTLGGDDTAIIEALNTGPLQEGYVIAVPPPGIIGYGLFRQSVPGIPNQEAVVPFSGADHSMSTLVYDETAYTTAAAIANPGSVPITVTITVQKADGTQIGTTTLVLPQNTHTAKVLNSLPNLSGMIGNRGIATFSVTSGNLAVLGLRFSGSAFTSIPTVDQ